MIMPYHWTQRLGSIGKRSGTLYMKLLDDNQAVKALVLNVAGGNRACVQIHDGNFRDKYWTKDLETGVDMANEFFRN